MVFKREKLMLQLLKTGAGFFFKSRSNFYEIKMFTRLATALTLKLKVQGSNFALKMKVFG